jgi:hypothetical protein
VEVGFVFAQYSALNIGRKLIVERLTHTFISFDMGIPSPSPLPAGERDRMRGNLMKCNNT